MSRVKLLLDVVEDMRSLADSLQTMANTIAGDDATAEPQAPAAARPRQKRSRWSRSAPCWLKRATPGSPSSARGLLQKYGAQKLSAIDPGRYADLLRDAEELNDAGK
jgi:hypothetical protein